jgi:hypothetical protein
MTSDRKTATNRRNSRKSSGPRTAAGKSIASRNALRHGLSAVTHHHLATAEVELLTKAICPRREDPTMIAQARIIAANELALQAISTQICSTFDDAGNLEVDLASVVSDLTRLDRYERRTWSRHKRAIRTYMHLKLMRDLSADQPT